MHDALEGRNKQLRHPVKPVAPVGHGLAATFAAAWPWPFMPRGSRVQRQVQQVREA
jgi:hypothetical protein